jgi:hypothetical protein
MSISHLQKLTVSKLIYFSTLRTQPRRSFGKYCQYCGFSTLTLQAYPQFITSTTCDTMLGLSYFPRNGFPNISRKVQIIKLVVTQFFPISCQRASPPFRYKYASQRDFHPSVILIFGSIHGTVGSIFSSSSKMSRPPLGPFHPPIQWVPRFFPRDKAVEAQT